MDGEYLVKDTPIEARSQLLCTVLHSVNNIGLYLCIKLCSGSSCTKVLSLPAGSADDKTPVSFSSFFGLLFSTTQPTSKLTESLRSGTGNTSAPVTDNVE